MFETSLYSVANTVKSNQSTRTVTTPYEKATLIEECSAQGIEVVIIDRYHRIHHVTALMEFTRADIIKIEKSPNLESRQYYKTVYVEI